MPWSWVTGKQKSFRHRGAERHDTSSLHVPNLGELLDLSITGMRIKVAGKPKMDVKQVLPLIICNQGQCVKVTAQVVWVRKAALTGNEYQVGIRFMDVKPGIAKALDQLARFGCITPSAGMGAAFTPAEAAGGSPASGATAAASATTSASTSAPPPAAPLITVEVEDLYANLGLAVGASEDQIRKAYHELAMKYHPDRSQEAGAEERFRMIAKTYLVLKDPEKRARYDAMLRGQAALHRGDARVSPEPAPAEEQRMDDMSDLMDESQRDAA
jgi:DnaJ-domain-containing protein 1